jgi:16S rRNA (guanine527-N7)-methyltransferase
MGMRELVKNELAKLGAGLSDEQAVSFEKYYELLVSWNKKVNLTAITEKEDVAVKHFADSLGLVLLKDEKSVKRILDGEGLKLIDVGAGAGFPGIPLKIVFPGLKVTLLDSLNKRVNFLNEVITELGLKGIEAVHMRAEDAAHDKAYREGYDIAVSRAVANMAVLSEYCIPFVKKGGCFMAYKSGEFIESGERDSALKAVKILGGEPVSFHEYKLPGTDYGRCIAVIKKTENTPKKYPRKAGLPSKEPLQ